MKFSVLWLILAQTKRNIPSRNYLKSENCVSDSSFVFWSHSRSDIRIIVTTLQDPHYFSPFKEVLREPSKDLRKILAIMFVRILWSNLWRFCQLCQIFQGCCKILWRNLVWSPDQSKNFNGIFSRPWGSCRILAKIL